MPTQIERDDKHLLKSIEQELDELKREAGAIFWRLGTRLGEVKRKKLWRAGGFASFEEWVKARVDMSVTWVEAAITVAAHFTLEMAERWGPSKLDHAVGYVLATKKKEVPGDIQALTFAVPGKGGRLESVAFPDATCHQMATATVRVRRLERARTAERRAEKSAPEPHVRERAAAVARVLPPVPNSVFRGERVSVKQKDGVSYVTLHAIDVSRLEEVIEALRANFGPLRDPDRE